MAMPLGSTVVLDRISVEIRALEEDIARVTDLLAETWRILDQSDALLATSYCRLGVDGARRKHARMPRSK